MIEENLVEVTWNNGRKDKVQLKNLTMLNRNDWYGQNVTWRWDRKWSGIVLSPEDFDRIMSENDEPSQNPSNRTWEMEVATGELLEAADLSETELYSALDDLLNQPCNGCLPLSCAEA